MSEERLSALAVLSMEKRLVRESSNLNNSVIGKFADLKDRRANFLLK